MSYNVAVCTPPLPLDDETAWGEIDALIDAQGPVPQAFRTLHDRLTARYPCICSLPDETVDEEGVWSDGPLQGRKSKVNSTVPLCSSILMACCE
jgi:hypothetical protein